MPPPRRYSTELRTEQTAVAQRLILASAGRLFIEKGYLGTTLAAVAAAAGVSVQTVYNVVGGKPALLKAVYDVTLAGDDEPVPIGDRPNFRAMQEATDGREMLARYAGIGRQLSERVLPLVTKLLAQAASGDPDLQAFADTIEGERATGTTMMAGAISERFGLRDGLTVQDAADILWTLTSPDLADRLVNRRGWGWDKTEAWLGSVMADALLGPSPMKGSPPTGFQRWLHRRWGILRVVVPVTSTLALVLGGWILFDHQPAGPWRADQRSRHRQQLLQFSRHGQVRRRYDRSLRESGEAGGRCDDGGTVVGRRFDDGRDCGGNLRGGCSVTAWRRRSFSRFRGTSFPACRACPGESAAFSARDYGLGSGHSRTPRRRNCGA